MFWADDVDCLGFSIGDEAEKSMQSEILDLASRVTGSRKSR
jgi:hypothetical protein